MNSRKSCCPQNSRNWTTDPFEVNQPWKEHRWLLMRGSHSKETPQPCSQVVSGPQSKRRCAQWCLGQSRLLLGSPAQERGAEEAAPWGSKACLVHRSFQRKRGPIPQASWVLHTHYQACLMIKMRPFPFRPNRLPSRELVNI